MKSMGKTAAVEGRHIVKNFRTGDAVTEVLKDLSLQVMQGEIRIDYGAVRLRKKQSCSIFSAALDDTPPAAVSC